MKPVLIATEIAEGAADTFRAELAGTTHALTHAREQHRQWSWYARWRGGGPEYRAHCQGEAAFYGRWIGRLERGRDNLLGKLAACAEPPYRFLH